MQLCLLEADGTYTCLEQQATQQLAIVHGQAELPPITIQPDWFTSNNKGIATIAVVSRPQAEAAAGSSSAQPWQRPPQQELGRLYLRLAPAAERLLVMPAGKLFEGAVLSIDSAPSSKRGAGRGQVTLQQVSTYLLASHSKVVATVPTYSKLYSMRSKWVTEGATFGRTQSSASQLRVLVPGRSGG